MTGLRFGPCPKCGFTEGWLKMYAGPVYWWHCTVCGWDEANHLKSKYAVGEHTREELIKSKGFDESTDPRQTS